MPNLFGVDIAKEINDAMGSGLLAATLIKVTPGTPTTGSLTSGSNPKTSSSSCRGVIEEYDSREIDGTIIYMGDRKVLLLGGSLPSGTVPTPGDRVTIEGSTFDVVGVKRDPAAASYTCQVRGV